MTPAVVRQPRARDAGYRWVVLAAATVGQMSFSAFILALPALAPALQDEYGTSLAGIGTFLSVVTLGLITMLLPWGIVIDRIGERLGMTLGLVGVALALVAAAFAPTLALLTFVLTLGAALGGCVNSGTGRAVMLWFPKRERGLALALRQGSMMFAAALAAIVLPRIAAATGLRDAFLVIAGACGLGAAAAAVFLRSRPRARTEVAEGSVSLRDSRLWRLSIGSALVCVAQATVTGFIVLYLHDARGVSPVAAGAALAACQVLGGSARIASGVWSDRVGSRVVPLRRIAITTAIALGTAAVLANAPLAVVYPAFVVAGGLSLGWNAVSFTAAAELGGTRRSGATLGLQQTVIGVAAILAPIGFALLVQATTWQIAWGAAAMFPLAGWCVLRALPVSGAYTRRRLLGRVSESP